MAEPEEKKPKSFRQANIVSERFSLRERYLRVPLRVRLTVWYSLVLAIALFAFALFSYWTVSASLYNNADSMLSEVADFVNETLVRNIGVDKEEDNHPVTNTGITGDEKKNPTPRLMRKDTTRRDSLTLRLQSVDYSALWTDLNRNLFLRSRSFYIQIADTMGTVIWKSKNLGRLQLPTYEDVSVGQDTGRIFLTARKAALRMRVQTMQSAIAQVTIGYNLTEIDQILQRLTDAFRLGFPISILLALGVGYLLARYSLRQVDIITNSAKRITAENLSKRLPMPATNDEIARLTTTLNEMIARLEGSFTQVRQFTSDVSHELRTPLAILMGELELALRHDLDAEEFQSMIASALEEVIRLSKMVSSLLEISRAETGQVKLNKTMFDISRMTSDICDDMEILAEDKRVLLEKNIQPFVTIVADESRLHQALLNVIDNAIKYTSVGGVVRVSLSTKSKMTRIDITDNGVGISDEDLPYIFNRFFRVDKARSSDVVGSGLGLSIVRWIVEAHRGTIGLKSELGVGTTVTLNIPYDS